MHEWAYKRVIQCHQEILDEQELANRKQVGGKQWALLEVVTKTAEATIVYWTYKKESSMLKSRPPSIVYHKKKIIIMILNHKENEFKL